MTQKQFDNLLEKLNAFEKDLDFSDREKEEYLNELIIYLENNENRFMDEDCTIEDIFDELRDQQDWNDGGFNDVMRPNVDEDDEEYPDGYSPCDNEEYRIHSELLDELQEYLKI